MARIIVADDQNLLREGLSSLLDSIEGFSVVAQASDGVEVLHLLEKHKPDLLILDVSLPALGGIGAIHRICASTKAPSILVLCDSETEAPIKDSLNAGAQGCLSTAASSSELQFAIESILQGLVYISPTVTRHLMEHKKAELASLTKRELEVFTLLAEGYPNRKVAKLLHISPRTIDSHRRNILKKLELENNSELVQLAMRMGVLSQPKS